MNKSKIILVIFVIIVVIKEFYILPAYLNIPLHFLSCLVSVGSDFFVYCYYDSFADAKKSLLSYTIMFLSFVSGLTLLWYNISAIILEFPDLLQPWFDTYPNMTCSVLRSETLGEMLLVGFTLVQLLKALIVYDSFLFQKLNHENTFKIILMFSSFIFFGGNILRGTYTRTLCTTTRFLRYEMFNGIKVSISEIEPGFSLYLLYTLFLLVASIFLGVLKKRKRKRLDRFSTMVNPQVIYSNKISPKQILIPMKTKVTIQNENLRNKKQLAVSNNICTISYTNESPSKCNDFLTSIEEPNQKKNFPKNSFKIISGQTTNPKEKEIPLAKIMNIEEYKNELVILREENTIQYKQRANQSNSILNIDPEKIVKNQECNLKITKFKDATKNLQLKGNFFYLKLKKYDYLICNLMYKLHPF